METAKHLGAMQMLAAAMAAFKVFSAGGSLLVQWLSLHVSNAGNTGLIPGWGAKIPHSVVERGKVLVTRSCLTL